MFKTRIFSPVLPLIALVFFLSTIIVSGCASVNIMKQPVTKRVEITAPDFDTAFSKAIRTCVDLGFDINKSDKDTGNFGAVRMKGAGLVGYDDLTFALDREGENKFSAAIAVTANDSNALMEEFLEAYGKYVEIAK